MPAHSADGEAQSLEGTLEQIIFRNEDESFLIGVVCAKGARHKVVGALAGLKEGERVRLLGRFVQNPKFGAQFRVEAGYPVLPYTAEGIRAYLASGHIKGIGAGLADRLVTRFGAETLEVIEHEPMRLADIPGIGPVRSRDIQAVFHTQRDRREALVFLQGHGVPPALAGRIWQKFEARTIPHIRENPYRLAEQVRGIGFATADRIAVAIGFALDAPERAAAGIAHLLGSAGEEGHVCLPEAVLLKRAKRLLGDVAVVDTVLKALKAEGRVIEDGDLYLRETYDLEVEAAGRLAAMLASPPPALSAATVYQSDQGPTLSTIQLEAVERAAQASVFVLTGGPGTGKTTVVRTLIHRLDTIEGAVALAAPTGRAARRLSEATGVEAKTLHRLLEFSPAEGGFRRDEETPLEVAAIVVDEASMIDLRLFVALLRAVPPHARLILVGDAEQLPSVGAGNVLADLLSAEVVPSARLVEVFRQAQESRIIINAHRVLKGVLPEAPTGDSDFYLVTARDAAHAAELIERLVVERMPAKFGLNPMTDIQVLTPMHRGACGTTQLNARLQARLNPDGETLGKGRRAFRVGDKVMQIRNDYEREVFNGDMGQVIARAHQEIIVSFDGRMVAYDTKALDLLTLAYACSVHKSQGSEYPAVVVPVLTEHWIMLQRNLLYTAMTRGKRLVVVVAQARALRQAVESADGLARYTGLSKRLRSFVA